MWKSEQDEWLTVLYWLKRFRKTSALNLLQICSHFVFPCLWSQSALLLTSSQTDPHPRPRVGAETFAPAFFFDYSIKELQEFAKMFAFLFLNSSLQWCWTVTLSSSLKIITHYVHILAVFKRPFAHRISFILLKNLRALSLPVYRWVNLGKKKKKDVLLKLTLSLSDVAKISSELSYL